MEAIEKTMTAGYGRERLDRVFKLVPKEDDWKAPIDAMVDINHPDIGGDLDVVREAVIFFTGTAPELYGLPGLTSNFVQVLALGYRNGPCGP